jgi:DNA-binding response OmpR family regulator
LKGIEGGADDYISKPFEKEMLVARVNGILKSRNNLQKYFYNEITLNNIQRPQDIAGVQRVSGKMPADSRDSI